MSLAIIYSRARVGIEAPMVTVETHISNGLPGLSIVGLPEATVKESKDRVRSALLNSHFEFPVRRITVNLAPADLPKEGGRFDLPIALGILAASGQIPSQQLTNYEFAGELALSGELRPFKGSLPFALAMRNTARQLIVPLANADEASLATEITVLPANHLLDVCAHIIGNKLLAPHTTHIIPDNNEPQIDLKDIQGQMHARRALEIAAAGGHSLLLIGPPGTGKTMLASRLPSILPPLTENEALEVAAVTSISRTQFCFSQWRKRPFRSPHHTASSVALVGGGSPPKPGEISLAHRGVLFLDELPEFNRHVLETLREPLESGVISISRATHHAEFPARFQLIAAMNPCPCGYLGSSNHHCRCSTEQIQRYRYRISGPLLDRIDMQLEVPALPENILASGNASKIANETSAQVKQRVIAAREKQWLRAAKVNAALLGEELEQTCTLAASDQQLLARAISRLGLSARTYHRIMRVARTIADLENSETVQSNHLTEALSYRCLDRKVNFTI